MANQIQRQDPGATRNMLAAMFLSLAIYSGYTLWMGPPKPLPEDAAPVAAAPAVLPAPVAAPGIAPAPAPAALPPVRELPFEACGAVGTWTTDGGVLRRVALTTVEGPYPVTQVWQWAIGRLTGTMEGPWKPYGQGDRAAMALGPDAHALAVGAGALSGTSPRMEILESSTSSVTFRGVTSDGIEVVQKVVAGGDPCVIDAEFTWRNPGSVAYTGGLWVGLHDQVGKSATFSTDVLPIALIDDDMSHPKLKNLTEPELWEGPVSWFSLSDRFYGTFVVPRDPMAGQLWFDSRVFPSKVAGEDEVRQYGAHWVRSASLGPGESYTAPMRVYLGGLVAEKLAATDPSLERAIDYGWIAAFASPMLWALKLIHGYVGNWGLAIIALTILVKAALFPLISAGMRSSMKMAAVQPKMKEIREQYKDDPEEMNRRVMELFKESGANPVGGCLPLLAQIPVFSSLYSVLQWSTELYHADFLYLRDLSSPDPYSILPLATMALMYGQQRMMPMTNLDPAQAQVMKYMPIFFGMLFFTAPSGLGVYMVVNIALSIAQQWWIQQKFPMKPATAPA